MRRGPSSGALIGLAGVLAACNSGITDDDSTTIRGSVRDAVTNRLLPGVRVTTAPVTEEARTNEDGRFELVRNVRFNQRYRVTAAIDTHVPRTVDFTPRVDRRVDLELELTPLRQCTAGRRRCTERVVDDGTPEPRRVEGFETCSADQRWDDFTACTEGLTQCFEDEPGCTTARSLEVTATGGLVLSSPSGISCEPTCSARFPDGTTVTLTAQPFRDASFLGWTGACSDRGTEPTCTLELTADSAAGATFTESSYPVEVDFRGDGEGEVRFEGRRDEMSVDETCRTDCTLRFDRDTVVTLTATPDSGTDFAGWSRDCSGPGGTCTLTVDEPKAVRAQFRLPRRTLEVSKTGAGAGRIESAPEGIDCGSDCTAEFLQGTVVTLAATPDPRNEFVGWSGDCSGATPTCEVTLDGDRSASAEFDGVSFELAVTKDGDGSGTISSDPSGIDCGPDCTEAFGVGRMVTLTASAAPGHRFLGWSGDCSGDAPTCEVTMDAARTVNASFEVIRLDVVATVAGDGRVVSTPAGIDCPGTCSAPFAQGTSLRLDATPNAGAAVESWSGVCASSGRTDACTFSVRQSETVDLVFTDFYRVPLPADMACVALFRFASAARLQDACSGANAIAAGSWSATPSRNAALGDAYGPSAEGDALDAGISLRPPSTTVEMTVRRRGAGFGPEAYGVLVSDRDRDDVEAGPGLELLAHDDGRIELLTWTSSVASSSVETSTGTLPSSSWAHVAAVVASSRLEIFVDGTSVARSTDAVEWTASSSTAVVGGRRDGADFAQTLDGDVDEVRASDLARY